MKFHRRRRLHALSVCLLCIGGAALIPSTASAQQPAAPTAAANTNNQATLAIAPAPLFEKLTGKWRRPDGGYILEIRSIEPGGKMDAGYANPRPINVSKAEASQDGTVTKVFIELRDVNYPGSTYTLAYDAASDQLAGIYYQAALQQQFDVFFERLK